MFPEYYRCLDDTVRFTVGPTLTARRLILLSVSADGRTRLSLFVLNLDLQPGENTSSVTARLEDGSFKTYPLTVETVARVPGFDWVTQVIVRLPDDTPNTQTLFVSVTLRGQTSNKARIRMK